MGVLILAVVKTQPEARFKPVHLENRLLVKIRTEPELNTSGTRLTGGVPHKNFASSIARRIVVILYHFRRAAPFPLPFPDTQETTHGDGVEAFKAACAIFNEVSTTAPAPLAIQPTPEKVRKLGQQLSACSLASDASSDVGFGAALGLVPNPGKQSFLDAAGLSASGAPSAASKDTGSLAVAKSHASRSSLVLADTIAKQAADSTAVILPPQRGAVCKILAKRRKRIDSCEVFESPAFGICKIHKCRYKAYILMFNEQTGKWPLLTNIPQPHAHALVDMMKDYIIHAGATITNVQCDDMPPALPAKFADGKGVSKGRRLCKKPAAKRAPSPVPPASSSASNSEQGSDSPWYENDSDADIDME